MKSFLCASLLAAAFAAAQAQEGQAPARPAGLLPSKDVPSLDQRKPAAPTQDIGRESKVDSVLASVNGEPVTLLDVLLESGREEARLAALFTGERLYTETANLRRKLVDEIIERKLVYDHYKQKPFDIERQNIEDMVDMLAQSMGDGTRKGLEKRAKAIGTSLDEIREKAKERIAVDIMFGQFCDRQVYITPKDVYDYYQGHVAEWTSPETLDLQLLLVKRDGGRSGLSAKDACAMMASSLEKTDEAKFKELARNYSDGPNASGGGIMGSIERSKLRPEFAAALKDAKTGSIACSVETPEGFYFIRVGAMKPSETLPFEKVEKEIRKKLEDSGKELKRKAYVEGLKAKAVLRYYF